MRVRRRRQDDNTCILSGSRLPPPPADSARGAFGIALRNMAWVLGDKALAMALGLLIFGLIGRALGPAGSGHFAFATALLQVGLGLSLVVSGSALLPRFCRMQAALPGAIANVFVVRLAASGLATAAMLVYCFLAIGDPQRRMVSMILLLAVPLIEPFYIVSTYWLSRNHNRPNIIARSSALLVRAATIVVGLHFGVAMEVLAAAWVIEGLVSAALQTAQLRSAMPGARLARFVSATRARAYLRFGLRFVPGLWLQALFVRIDRLMLGERMEAGEFGLYATAMQLTEVWTQVAYLIGVSLATAYLYQRIRQGRFGAAFMTTSLAMTGIGLAGFMGAWLFGPWLLRSIFGAPFAAAYPSLLAGMAFAVLLFANQIVQLTLTTLDRPQALLWMWVVASIVAIAVIHFGYERWGAFAGPIGLAVGTVAGWLGMLPLRPWRGRPTSVRRNMDA
jgi:O-antigen/teichoic acid export membrane protein